MSYEGYSQFLCAVGHYWEEDCLNTKSPTPENCCPFGHRAVWENMVDVTNGSFEDEKRIDGFVELEVVSSKECEVCHTVLETIYKIPKKGEKP